MRESEVRLARVGVENEAGPLNPVIELNRVQLAIRAQPLVAEIRKRPASPGLTETKTFADLGNNSRQGLNMV